VSYKAETPFDSIESAHTYLGLLIETAREAREAVDADAALIGDSGVDERRAAVLHLVAYNLDRLDKHVKVSRRILNDLRTLRRLLLEERRGRPQAVITSAESRTSNYA
jgi:hypothetical protein